MKMRLLTESVPFHHWEINISKFDLESVDEKPLCGAATSKFQIIQFNLINLIFCRQIPPNIVHILFLVKQTHLEGVPRLM